MANVEEVQEKIFIVFEYFHRFCEENEIPYCIIAGTLLGAVRHKGFIPWDDDIDVGVPRDYYNKLLQLSNRVETPFELEEYRLNNEYYYPFAKLYHTQTTAIEDVVKPLHRGVWVDIFPLDGTFSNPRLRALQFFIINVLRRLISYKNGGYSERDKSGFTKNFIRALSVSLKLVPNSLLFFILGRVLTLKSFTNSKVVGNLLGFWGEGELMRDDIFGEFKEIEFNGMSTYSPSKPHEYLESLYGDYMQLPPEDKRKSHFFRYINL